MKFFLLNACVAALLLSCGGNQKKEGKILDEKKMQAVMWDMLQADAFTQNFIKRDSSKNDTLENAGLQKKNIQPAQNKPGRFLRQLQLLFFATGNHEKNFRQHCCEGTTRQEQSDAGTLRWHQAFA